MNERAGTPATTSDLISTTDVIQAYYSLKPDVSVPAQRVVFGTSGHRGSSLDAAFNEDHIAAITQAIVEYRTSQGTTGPLFIGCDTHALSRPAESTALEVLTAAGVRVLAAGPDEYVPTPALSHAILTYNRDATGRAGGRHHHHAQPQPAARRRLQIQPTARRSGRQRRHRVDRTPRQRTARGRQPRCGQSETGRHRAV